MPLKQRCGGSGALGGVGQLGMGLGPGCGRRVLEDALQLGAVPARCRAATRGKWRPTVTMCHRSRARYRRDLKAQGPSHRSVGTEAGVAHPIPSARPSLPARSRAGPPAPSPSLEQPVPSGSHRGTAAGLTPPARPGSRGCPGVATHCPAVTTGFLRDCSSSFSLFMTSAPSRLKTGSIPASPSPTARPCLTPVYKQVGAASVVAPAQSCSIPLNVSGARSEPPQALLGSSAGG